MEEPKWIFLIFFKGFLRHINSQQHLHTQLAAWFDLVEEILKLILAISVSKPSGRYTHPWRHPTAISRDYRETLQHQLKHSHTQSALSINTFSDILIDSFLDFAQQILRDPFGWIL